MTFKELMRATAYLPATIFSGTVNLILGNTKKNTHGKVELDKEQRAKINYGLLGLVLGSVAYIGRSIADFIADHKQAIATAFWSSLVLGGAAALTVFLWPAALTAVATFSIYGFSIAGVVGANTALQIGAIAALTFTATSLATYLAATVVNTISAIIDYCFKHPTTRPSAEESSSESEDDSVKDSAHSMRKLSTTIPSHDPQALEVKEQAPVHTATVFPFSRSPEEEAQQAQVLTCKQQ